MNISIRELAQQIAALSRRIDALSAPQLSRSSIEDGAIHEYDVDGNLVTIIGRQDDGSHGVVVIDGPEPLRTSTPIAEAGALTIATRWDGNFIDPDTGEVDANLPAYDDFKHIEVHVGAESSFHPDRNTLAGFIPNRDGGEVSVPAEAGERYVRFVTRAISGKTSVPSIATMVQVDTLVDVEQFDALRDLLDQAAAWIAETGAELEQRLADAEVDLADAQAGLDEAAERLNTLRDVTLPALYTRLDEAEGRLADIPDLMEGLQDAIDAANAAIDALDIEALRDRLDAAEGDLARLEGTTLPALRTEVESAQGRLDTAFGEGATWSLNDAFDDAQQAAQAAAVAGNTNGPNLITDPTRLGTMDGTGWAGAGMSVVETDFFDQRVKAVRSRSAINVQNMTDVVKVDITKTYVARYWVRDTTPRTGSAVYIGLRAYTEAGSIAPLGDVFRSNGIANPSNTNPYFTASGQNEYAPGEWHEFVGYIYPVGTDPEEARSGGTNNQRNFIFTEEVDGVTLRVLNWANYSGEENDLFFLASLREVGSPDAADLTPRPHTSTDAPGNTVMPRGTRWEQIDSAGRVIGIWEQTAAPEGASWATRALDLSLLRASSAVIDDLLVERMAVAIATVIELNADRIRSGQIDAEFIDVSDLSAALATVLELDAGVITTGELGADRINVADLTAAIATIIELNADQITSGTIKSGQIDTTDLAATLATIIELDAGAITSGTIDTARLDAVELAAEMAEFIQARIENLVVTEGATIDTGVINKLWTDVVRSRKITTDMLLVGSGNNHIPNGALVGDISEFFTAASGWNVVEEDGRQAIRFTGSASRTTFDFPLEPGEYKYSVEARAGVADTRFYVQLGHNGPDSNPYLITNQVIDGTFGFGTGMSWKTFTGTVTVPESGFGNAVRMVVYPNHSNGVQSSWQEMRGFKLTSMTDASLIVDGAIAARHIDAESIAAEVAEFISVKAENIEAGNIQVALTLSAAGRIIAGQANGAAAELSSRGLEVWTTDARGDRHDIPLTRLGVPGATDVLSISDGTDVVASITPDGAISGSSLDVGEDAHIAGQLLMGAFAYRDSDGSGDRESAFWNVPWGIQGPITNMASVAGHLSAAHNTTQLMMYDTFRLFAGRAYRFVADMTLQTTNILNENLAHAIIRMQKTEVNGFNSVPSVPSLSGSENILFRRIYTPGSSVNAPIEATIIPSRDETARVAIALSGIQATQSIETPSKFYLEDMGASAGWGGGVAYGQSTPPVQKYTYYFYPTAVVSRQGSWNSTMVWNGVAQHNKMTQGWLPGVTSGPWHTFGRFYNATSAPGSSQTGISLASAISGATRVDARVRLTSAYSARNTVQARLSARTNETTVPAPQTSSAHVAPGGTVTTALNAAMLNTLRASPGSLRIAVGPGSGTSSVDLGGFYGTDGNTNQRMRLQVDVWK